LERIRQLVKIIDAQLETPGESLDSDEIDANVIEARARFIEHMDNDFNTTYALRTVFELVRDVNRRINEKTISRRALSDVKEMLREFGEILGVSFSATEKGPTGTAEDQTGNLIELLIDIRQKLREKKDWQLADEIRNGLNELNVVLEDEKAGKGN
jgi:cysteinyl-tRNA synthetase